MDLRGLAHDRADAVGLDDAPNEERDAGDGDNDGLDGEKVSHFVNGHPDSWQGDQPEEEETHKIAGVCAGRCGHRVR